MSLLAIYGTSAGTPLIEHHFTKLSAIHYRKGRAYYLLRVFVRVLPDSSPINALIFQFDEDVKEICDIGQALTNSEVMGNLAEHNFNNIEPGVYDLDGYVFRVPSCNLSFQSNRLGSHVIATFKTPLVPDSVCLYAAHICVVGAAFRYKWLQLLCGGSIDISDNVLMYPVDLYAPSERRMNEQEVRNTFLGSVPPTKRFEYWLVVPGELRIAECFPEPRYQFVRKVASTTEPIYGIPPTGYRTAVAWNFTDDAVWYNRILRLRVDYPRSTVILALTMVFLAFASLVIGVATLF